MLVSDIITRAFENLGVITVAETITSAMQTDAFNRLNRLLDTFSAEGLVVPNQVEQQFSLVAGSHQYTLGPAGSFATTGGLRAMKVTAWRAWYGSPPVVQSGGRLLSMAEFGMVARQRVGETATVPEFVGADTNPTAINIRMSPPPNNNSATIEFAYWTPLALFSTVGDSVTSPAGLANLFEWHLAKDLWPQYPSQSRLALINEMCQVTKAALVEENAITAPQPTPAAPQGQKP